MEEEKRLKQLKNSEFFGLVTVYFQPVIDGTYLIVKNVGSKEVYKVKVVPSLRLLHPSVGSGRKHG